LTVRRTRRLLRGGGTQARLDTRQDIIPGEAVGLRDGTAVPQALQASLSLDFGAGLGVAGQPGLDAGALLVRQLAIDVGRQPSLRGRRLRFRSIFSFERPHNTCRSSPSSLIGPRMVVDACGSL